MRGVFIKKIMRLKITDGFAVALDKHNVIRFIINIMVILVGLEPR